MQKSKFIKELKQPYPTEVFIDTIKGRHPADETIPVKGRWVWDSKRKYHYAPGLPFLKATAKLLFKKHKDKPYDGNVFCEFSAPKVLYGQNISGILYEDRTILYDKVKELLTVNGINIDLAEKAVDFRTFDVTRIDLSFSFFVKNDTEQKEFMRLFRNMYHPHLKPGKSGSRDYDYPNAFCFTSPKLDIVLYDKAKELNIKNVNLLRLEFKCKKTFKKDNAGSDFFDSFENTMKKANKWLANKLEYYNLSLPFLPEEEYFKAISACYISKKKEHDEKTEDSPLYLRHELSTLIKTIKDINNKGCYNYHSLNRDMYNKCLHLAKDAGVQLLYTKLPYSISFTDNVCYHADAQKIVEISSVPP